MTYGLDLALAQAHGRGAGALLLVHQAGHGAIDPAPAHVHDDDELGARIGLEAVGGETLVDGVQEPVIAAQADPARGVVLGAELEDVQRAAQDQTELEWRADRREEVGDGVVGGEYRDMERVVLRGPGLAGGRAAKATVLQNVTFRPMTPRHTIDGIEAAIGLPRSARFGSFLSVALFLSAFVTGCGNSCV